MDANEESQLERRAVEELLKEASRARVRAETMGPAGWRKCPLGSTNKRFLLNTLRSSAVERRSGGSAASVRRGDESRRDREKHRHSEEKEHKKGHGSSRSPSDRHHTTSRRALTSRGHSPHQSNRTKSRSRSPDRDRAVDGQSRDRTQKIS